MPLRILETTNYSKFTLTDFNRDVRNTKKLKASMQKHGFIAAYAIHVIKEPNGKLRIKEGHHRFKVAMDLGLPIYYIICDYEADIQIIAGATRPWDLQDYLCSWARMGKEPYIKLKEYWQETGIPLTHCIAMLSGISAGSDISRKHFKDGDYCLGDSLHPAIIKDLVLHCKKLGVKWASHHLLVQAFSRVVQADGFDAAVLKQRISTNLHLMEKKALLKDYVNMLDKIFNYKARIKIPLAFNAEEAARERDVVRCHSMSGAAPKKRRSESRSVGYRPTASQKQPQHSN